MTKIRLRLFTGYFKVNYKKHLKMLITVGAQFNRRRASRVSQFNRHFPNVDQLNLALKANPVTISRLQTSASTSAEFEEQ